MSPVHEVIPIPRQRRWIPDLHQTPAATHLSNASLDRDREKVSKYAFRFAFCLTLKWPHGDRVHLFKNFPRNGFHVFKKKCKASNVMQWEVAVPSRICTSLSVVALDRDPRMGVVTAPMLMRLRSLMAAVFALEKLIASCHYGNNMK